MFVQEEIMLYFCFTPESKQKTVLPIQYMSQFAWLNLFC